MRKAVLFRLWQSMAAFASLLVPISVHAAPGDIFEGDGGSGIIYKFTSSGTKTVFASGLSGRAGLAFDGSGNLFAAEINTRTIYKFTRTGTKTAFASGANRSLHAPTLRFRSSDGEARLLASTV